jgi:hypothetical protein
MNCCRGRYSLYISKHKITGGNNKQIKLDINDKIYKNLLIKYDPNNETILNALNIVKKYIIREKLIIVGGMAIDYALRLRGSKLYDDNDIPDYDFLTPHHWIDTMEIAQWLKRVGINDLSVINAQHPITMRVRILSTSVADATFCPSNIYDNIPRLNYHGMDIVHPYFQYLDQHSAFTYGYDNLDLDRPVLLNRWTKDMKRYDLLWEKYPLKWEGEQSNLELDIEKIIPIELLDNQCIGGFIALQYWVNWANKKGFKSKCNNGLCEINQKGIIYTIPVDSHGISIYTINIKELYNKIIKKYKPKDERFYNPFLDKVPRKIILDNEWELLDIENRWISAHKIKNFYVVNLQCIMLYMLVNYILLNKMKKEQRGYAFYTGYMTCRELLKFGAINKYDELLPTEKYYGENNISDVFNLGKLRFLSKNNPDIKYPKQPNHLYEKDLYKKTVDEKFFKFNPNESELFKIDGEQVSNFLN